eukprot:1903103-Ditylum_brightwellii.AAC.1
MAGATIVMMLIIIVHHQVDMMAGEDMLITKVVVHTIMKLKCNIGAYQSFGPGVNGGRFQHHGRGGNWGRFHHHGRGDNTGCHHMSDS